MYFRIVHLTFHGFSCGCRGQNSTAGLCTTEPKPALKSPILAHFPSPHRFSSPWNQAEYTDRQSFCSQGFSSSAEIIILNFSQRKWSRGELRGFLTLHSTMLKMPCKADFTAFAMNSKGSWIVLGLLKVFL